MWTAGVILFLNSILMMGGQYGSSYSAKKAADKANAKLAQHQTLTEDEVSDLKKWQKTQDRWRAPDKKKFEDIAPMQKGYWSAQGHVAQNVLLGELKGAYFGFGDWVGLMLLGMALYKNGFLPGRLEHEDVCMDCCDWAVGGLGCDRSWCVQSLGWTLRHVQDVLLWMQAPYDIGRIAGALGKCCAAADSGEGGRVQVAAGADCGGWTDGAVELSADESHDEDDLRVGIVALVWLCGVLQDLLCRAWHVDLQYGVQLNLAAVL